MIHAIVTKVHALTFDTKPYESRTLAPSDASFFLSKPFPFAKKALRNDEDDFCCLELLKLTFPTPLGWNEAEDLHATRDVLFSGELKDKDKEEGSG